MKTIFKVTLVFVLVAFANTLFAAGNLKVNILPVSAEKAVVAISALSNSNFNITITDEQDRIVYYNETTDPGENYRRVYNFSDLEDGMYKLSVVSNNFTAERPFQKTHKGITVGDEKTTIEPFFGVENGILRCTYLNFPNENLTLYFFEDNQLLYSKKIGRNFNVCEGLNLSKLGRGDYQAILSTGEKEYSYPVHIQ